MRVFRHWDLCRIFLPWRHSQRAWSDTLKDLGHLRTRMLLHSAAFGGPVHKVLHVFPVLPGDFEELRGGQIFRFFAEEGLQPPTKVRTIPGVENVAPGCNLVITQ